MSHLSSDKSGSDPLRVPAPQSPNTTSSSMFDAARFAGRRHACIDAAPLIARNDPISLLPDMGSDFFMCGHHVPLEARVLCLKPTRRWNTR